MSEIQLHDNVSGVSFSSQSLQIRNDSESLCLLQRSGYEGSALEINLEAPEEVQIPNESVQTFTRNNNCSFQFCKPKAGYYKEAIAIREYRKHLQKEYDAILELMNWIQLPGFEHQKVKGQNYLSCQFWLYSYAIVKIDDKEKQKDFFESKQYEDAVVAAEETGMILRQYLRPLEKITNACKYLQEMKNLIVIRHPIPDVENIETQSGEIIKEAILKGNKIQDFNKLQIFCRGVSKMQWCNLQTLSLQNQLSHLTNGLDQFIRQVRTIRILLDSPLRSLKKATSNICSRGLTLIPHIKKMHNYLKQIMEHEEVETGDEDIIRQLYIEINTHVLYIVQTGRNLVTKVWETILMTRLSYEYVSSNARVELVSYKEILDLRFQKNVKNLLKSSLYDSDQFLLASCPDILRKVPILINRKLELALHYEGHRNIVKTPGSRILSQSYIRRKSTSFHQFESTTALQNIRSKALKASHSNPKTSK